MLSRRLIPTIIALALSLGLSIVGEASLAATMSANSLKIGELTQAAYSSAALFTLTSATPEQRAFIIVKLSEDGSPMALQALREIAASSSDHATADAARAELAHPRGANQHSPHTQLLEAFRTAKIPLNFNSGSLPTNVKIPADLTNGSRYFVQTWFLKNILALHASTNEERASRFDLMINDISVYLTKPAKTVKIENEKDLEAFKSSIVPPYAYLADEMKFSKGLSDREPVRLEIASSMTSKVEEFSNTFLVADRKIPELNGSYFFDALTSADMSGALFRLMLKAQPVAEKLKQVRQVSNEFETKYQSLQKVANELVQSKVIKFSNPAEQRFFELMISHYFSTYTFEETADVMKAVLERPDHQTPNDLFHLMVMFAGPQMQKLLQVVSRRPGISPELQTTFKKLEESGLGSAWENISMNFTEPPEGTEWIKLDRTPRVGSMAETYKGAVRTSDGSAITIAARTLKANIRERVAKEIPRLIELGRVLDADPILRRYDFPRVGPAMDDVMSMTKAELDVAETTRNQIEGEKIYSAAKVLKSGLKIEFQTPKTLVASNSDVTYATWLKGDSFEAFVKKDPSIAVQLAEATAYHWIENALFKQRFFHADLHQGNMKVSERAPGDYIVGLLDFGMVGRINAAERSTIIKLSLAAVRNKNPSLIAQYLFELSEKSKNTVTLEELRVEAAKYLALNKGPLLTMDIWIGWSMSRGLKLPKSITAFSRGIGAMEQLTVASGSKKWLADMVKEVAMKHKLELAPDLARYLRDSVVTSVSDATKKLKATISSPRGPALTCSALFGN